MKLDAQMSKSSYSTSKIYNCILTVTFCLVSLFISTLFESYWNDSDVFYWCWYFRKNYVNWGENIWKEFKM